MTQNVAHYPLHHVTYSATKFEVAMSNRLGGDTLTRKVTDRPTTDRLWYKIYISFFLKKSGYNKSFFGYKNCLDLKIENPDLGEGAHDGREIGTEITVTTITFETVLLSTHHICLG